MATLFIPTKTGKAGKKIPKSGTRRVRRQNERDETMRAINAEIAKRNEFREARRAEVSS